MMTRMGIDPKPKSPAQIEQMRRVAIAERALPDDIDFTLEVVVSRMIGLLLIEISAFHGFAWAEAVLGDGSLVAGDGAAAAIVSYIRSDETPHVAWLRTALSEMRDRTWIGESGRRHPGNEMIGRLWNRALTGLGHAPTAGEPQLHHRGDRRMPWPAGRTAMTSWTRCCRWDRWCGEKTAPRSTAKAPPCLAEHPRGRPTPAPTRSPAAKEPIMKFGIFYEHQLPRPWSDTSEQQLICRCPGPDRAGRPARGPVPLGSGAPLSGGVLALQRTGGVPGRGQSAYQADADRPRRRPDRPGLQPPRPDRRTDRHARPGLQRAGRVRNRRIVLRGRAGRIRRRPGDQTGGVAGGAGGGHPLHDRDSLRRRRGQVRAHAAPQRGAQAGAEAASPAVGGVQPAGHHPARRRKRHRRPQFRLRRARGRQAVGRRLRDHPPRPVRPGGPVGQPPGGLRHPDDVRPPRGGCPGPWARGGQLLRLLARPLLRVR